MGGRLWVRHAQHDYASMLLARGEPTDKQRARELMAELPTS
jgi:hypothetical protein